MLGCIAIATFVIVRKSAMQRHLSSIFNFRKEIRKIRKQKQVIKPVKDISNMTLIGTTSGKKKIYTQDDMKHCFVCGTTGSGKTVVLSNYIKSAIEKDYPCLIVDGKGDIGENSILDIIHKMNSQYGYKKKVYVIDMNNPQNSYKYNPFQGSNPTVIKDMLINMTEWSEEHYKLNTERYIQRLIYLMDLYGAPLTFENIIKCIPSDKFLLLSAKLLKLERISKDEHIQNTEIARNSGKISESTVARFSTVYESEIGQIFSNDGIDIYQALKEKAIILFVLNPLIYPELSPLMGRLVLIDSKKAVSKLFNSNHYRTFFIFDEINVYASPTFLDLVNKSRSANVTCVLATQSLSDLDFAVNEAFKEQIIENCNNYIALRQNSSVNAENWAKILGTKSTMEVTYQIQQKNLNTSETGFGSARRVREFYYHPDDIKSLKTGQGIFLSRDAGIHSRINVNKPF